MFNPIPLIATELRCNALATAAVALLIAVAVALGVAVSAQERALRSGSAVAADRFELLIGAPGSATELVLSAVYLQPGTVPLVAGSLLAELAADPAVAWVAPIAFGDSYNGYPIVGTSRAFLTPLATGAPFDRRFEAVVGAKVALALGERFTPLHGRGFLTEEATAHGATYQVVGRLEAQNSPWDSAILVPVESVWQLHGLGHGAPPPDLTDNTSGQRAADQLGAPWPEAPPGVPAIVVKANSPADAYRLRARYRARSDTLAVFPAEVLFELYSLLGNARDLLALFAVATQGLVVAAVLLALLAALAQRQQQLAILRALGASKGYLFASVWSFATLLIGAGSLLGLGLGWLLAQAISHYLSGQTGLALAVALSWQELYLALALVAVGGLLALIPALLTYRQPVSSHLRR